MTMLLLCILSLAASFLLPATGEVVRNFKPCKEFFLDGKPPLDLHPDNPARICQVYENKYRFATMYDRNRRIPMFSAYKYDPRAGARPDEWMIEPQLALPKRDKRMETEQDCGINQELLEMSQAVLRDYSEAAPYDKGHLAPSSHQGNAESKIATFTLTNIVPQLSQLNAGQWREYEESINVAGCSATYILVGAVPGNTRIKDRVNIPSHIWAAGCCVLQNKQRRSWAAIAENNQNTVVKSTLVELQKQLATLYGKRKIDLFNNVCNVPQNRAQRT